MSADENAQTIRVPKPQILTGPKRMTADEATVMYLRDAATRVREQRYWGSGVTALVSDLLDNAAGAIEASATPAQARRVVDGHTDQCSAPGYRLHIAVGAGAISSPYLCHGCSTWFTLETPPARTSSGGGS